MKIKLSGFLPDCQGKVKIIVSEEERKVHRALNNRGDNIRRYKIDGYVIDTNATVKCDYLLLNDTKNNAYFIELKGKHFKDAYEQVMKTAELLKAELQPEYTFLYRIIHTGHPSVNNSVTRDIQKHFAGKAILIGNKKIPLFAHRSDVYEDHIS
jgi:hypothetical protein